MEKTMNKFLIYTNPISITVGAGVLLGVIVRRIGLIFVGIFDDCKKIERRV